MRYKLFEVLLRLNHEFANTEFQYDKPREMIIVSNEIHADALVYDVFEEFYDAIINSVKMFFEEGLPELEDYMDELRRKSIDLAYA